MYTTRVTQLVRAPRPAVYRALLDAAAIPRWRVPTGMSCRVHEFEPREGGYFRVSLTYDEAGTPGKSDERTDTYHGRFAELVPEERIVEVIEFESADTALAGEMTLTTTLTAVPGGTVVTVVHDGVPDAVAPADNETGTRTALAKLAQLVAAAEPGR